MSRPRDIDDATRRCRCQDAAGSSWLYLNAFCLYREDHKPLADYGFPSDPITVGAREYARAWMAGEYDGVLPPEMRPGYRPVREDRA